MFVEHICYRTENGSDFESAGYGLSPAAARQDAVYRAKAFVLSAGERFTLARVDVRCADDRTSDRKIRNSAIPTRAYLAALQ